MDYNSAWGDYFSQLIQWVIASGVWPDRHPKTDIWSQSASARLHPRPSVIKLYDVRAAGSLSVQFLMYYLTYTTAHRIVNTIQDLVC